MAQFGIIGHKGRMGQALWVAIEEAGHEVAGGIDAGEQSGPLATQSDALIDFSAPAGLEANIAAARVAGIPILIGTTGLEAEHQMMIDEAASVIPLLQTGNTSLGVTLLAHLVETAAAKLSDDWDILEYTSGRIRLIDVSGGDGSTDYLTFEKI